jgi:hypothetical protein
MRGQLKAAIAQRDILAEQSKTSAEQSKTLSDTVATNQEIERAYVTMGYRGLLFLEREHIGPVRPADHHEHPDTVDLVVELKDIGRTPGDIIGGWCGFLYHGRARRAAVVLHELA